MDKGVTTISMSEAGQFVNEDLMDKIGDLLNEAKISIATVHFTLAYMIADSLAQDCEDPRDIAVGVMSMQQYMMQVSTNIYHHNQQKKAH